MEVERTTLFICAAAVEGMLWKLRKDAYQSGLERSEERRVGKEC